MRTLFQSDKAHVFLFHRPKRRERERQTDSESSQHGTHTHARTSAAEALFCVGYLVFHNNAQRERERETEREISINEVKENVSRRSLPKHGGEDVGFIFEEDETEQPR